MRDDEIERALADAYAYADRAFMAINGLALEIGARSLADLAQSLRELRDTIGTISWEPLSPLETREA